LEEHGLTVAGGRDSGVGASGFIFGGKSYKVLASLDDR